MEFLKPIFGDKAMTYAEFSSALAESKDIKVANIASGEYVAKGKFDAAETKIAGLQRQLDDANAAIKSFDGVDVNGIKQQVSDWETKYNTDTAALKQQLADTEYSQTVREATAGLKFTSESAKRAFVADLTAKKLQVQDGKLLGLDDFTKSYKETDPTAFVSDDGTPPPVFTKTTNNNNGGTDPDAALRAAFGLPATKKE